MKINLLLKREPFGSILQKTMVRFWSQFHGEKYQVHWREGHQWWYLRDSNKDKQTWLVNSYLNAIFVPDAEPDIFDPIRREFSRSTIWWKRPIQQGYVSAALSRSVRAWLANAILYVEPEIKNASKKLIVAGNHKIRIIDFNSRLSYCIKKSGFNGIFMQREVSTRKMVMELGIPTPSLSRVSTDGDWYSEQLIVATPLNRMRNIDTARSAQKTAINQLRRMIDRTLKQERMEVYLNKLTSQIESMVANSILLSNKEKDLISKYMERLQQLLMINYADKNMSLSIATTHGDFQPGNILVNEDQLWLIDWEYADYRQAAYDLLVYCLNARSPRALSSRLMLFVEDPIKIRLPGVADWPGLLIKEKKERIKAANVFLMEELALHLEENAQAPLFRYGEGLRILLAEIRNWLDWTG